MSATRRHIGGLYVRWQQSRVDVEQVRRRDDEDQSGHVGAKLQKHDRLGDAHRDQSPHDENREHGVVDRANVAAAPRTHPTAACPQNVRDRAHHPFEVVELRLEEEPRAEERDDSADACAGSRADRRRAARR